jgi:type VI secretion system protein ImpK
MDRVNQITKDCFDTVIQLRQAEPTSLPSPETLRHRLRTCVEQLLERAGDVGFSHQDAQDMAYAVAALMDEAVLARGEPLRQFWMSNLLQLHFFHENVAGENFFSRLQQIRADPTRREALRVYYLCLVFGFQGRHRTPGGELELMRLIEAIQGELTRGLVHPADVLSPHGARPPDSRLQVTRGAPLLALSAGAVALALLVLLGLRFALGSRASSVITEMDAFATQASTKE